MANKTQRQSKHLTLDELKYIKAVKGKMNGKTGFAKHVAEKLGVSIGAAQKAIADIDGRIENFGVGRAGMSQTEFNKLAGGISVSGTASVPNPSKK